MEKTEPASGSILLTARKLTSLLLFVACLQVSARGWSQVVSLSEKNAPLEKVFSIIEKQTGYTFYYKVELLQRAKKVDVSFKNAKLNEVLDFIFKDQPLTYTIVEKNIVVKAKEPAAAGPAEIASNLPPPVQIKGRVVSATGPLKGASVMSKKTYKGTSTDEQGSFTFTGIPDADTLTVSFIGYETQQVPVKQATNGSLLIWLQVAVSALDEVQVIAYGTTTQRYNVGSIATVGSKEIEAQPVMNPLEALAGRVAGLQVTTTSGAPGALVLAQVRGQNTLDLGGGPYFSLKNYSQPLYIVDGIPFAAQNTNLAGSLNSVSAGPSYSSAQYGIAYSGISPLNTIDPLDIESITVLKDADATAIYGSRGANGAILITTKKGRPGRSTLRLSTNSGPAQPARHVAMMNTRQYLQMRREALQNDGITPSIAPGSYDFDLLLFDSTKSTDWYNRLLGHTAQHTDVHIDLSGGDNVFTYMVGAGYTRSGFNYPGNFADQRYTLNSNFTLRSANNRLTLGIASLLSYEDNKNSSGTNSVGLINLPPNFPDMLDSRGNLVWDYKGYDMLLLSNYRSQNYYAGLLQPYRGQNYMLNQSMHWSYSVLKGLNLEGIIGYSRLQSNGYSAIPIVSQNPLAVNRYGSANFQTMTRESIDIEPQVTYNRTFGRARVSVVVGGSYQKDVFSGQTITGNNYLNDGLLNSIAGASVVTVTLLPGSGLVDKYAGGFARANLVWNNRYIVNLTGNINGSSLFGPDRRFGNFGSAGAGWIFSETKWIKAATPWLSFGKIAVNYGVTGSSSVQPYQYQANWGATGSYQTYQTSMFYYPTNLLSPDFHWASTHKYDGNLSLGFFHDWLLIDLGGYLNWTSDQLLPSPLPTQSGFTSVTENAPFTLQNKGWEVTIRAGRINMQGNRRNKFTWLAPSFTISRNYNKITHVDPTSTYANVYRKGLPATAYPFVKYAGVDPATGLFQYLKADGKTLTTSPNLNSAFSDFPGDANQMVDVNPRINLGFGDGFSWKGVTVEFHGRFVRQTGFNYLYSLYYQYSGVSPGAPSANMPALIMGKEWRNPGDNATLQRFSTGLINTAYFTNSTAVITDASYLRIDNVNISYRVPAGWLRPLRITNCDINIRCQNALTITPYKLGDPESQSIYRIQPPRVFNGGLNLTF